MKIRIRLSEYITLMLMTVFTMTLSGQEEYFERTFNVDGRRFQQVDGFMLLEFTIVSSTGITWLKVSQSSHRIAEAARHVIYDGVPIVGSTTPTVTYDAYPVTNPRYRAPAHLYVYIWGEGSITLRFRRTGDPGGLRGQYLDAEDREAFPTGSGTITANPPGLSPGQRTNLTITLPNRIRPHVSEVVLEVPGNEYGEFEMITLPYQPGGVYNYLWTVPSTGRFDRLTRSTDFGFRYTAWSNKPDEFGRSYVINTGKGSANISRDMSIRMFVQDIEVPLGESGTWRLNREEREVSALIELGRYPFDTRWLVNGVEVQTGQAFYRGGFRTVLKNQNALADASAITLEVTDANANTASGTIYVGVRTDLDFTLYVTGVEAEDGANLEWRYTSGRVIRAWIHNGELPFRIQWIINGSEVATTTINRGDGTRDAYFRDDDALSRAGSLRVTVTDGNGVTASKIVYFTPDAELEEEEDETPSEPVGPAPTPPPVTGPTWEPHPDVEWNNRPWLDDRVQLCIREYLQNIVFYVENEYVKWENTALPEFKQRPLFTYIDDWGRLLSPFITATGGVDGNWDNPTHYVWSAYNRPVASDRYGRTVEYYVKYECRALEPSPGDFITLDDQAEEDEPDDIMSAINELVGDNDDEPDGKDVTDALSNLFELLDIERTLYRQFNSNHSKFVNEMNDRRANPLQNELIAFMLASAQNNFDNHSINKDTLDALGSRLIGLSAIRSEIDMFEIIRIMSEVQGQQDDMTRKLEEMRGLLASYGGDVKEIMQIGQQIAQTNVDPEFAQDGGINVEFFGDALDNIGDGLQDFLFGNVRRGNVLIVLFDSGNILDDIFEISISGVGRLGENPAGGRRNFDITLNPGTYTLTVRGIYTDPNYPPLTYGIQVYDRNELILEDIKNINENDQVHYTINIK